MKETRPTFSKGRTLKPVAGRYSLFSALWAEGTFSLSRYGAFIVAALPVTAVYAVSNVIFLLALSALMGEKLERITKKYGI